MCDAAHFGSRQGQPGSSFRRRRTDGEIRRDIGSAEGPAWLASPTVPEFSSSRQPRRAASVAAKTLALIRERERFDIALYDYASSLFEKATRRASRSELRRCLAVDSQGEEHDPLEFSLLLRFFDRSHNHLSRSLTAVSIASAATYKRQHSRQRPERRADEPQQSQRYCIAPIHAGHAEKHQIGALANSQAIDG